MPEYPAWWPKPRHAHSCTLTHVLHDRCGHAAQSLDHSTFHLGASQRSKQWHIMPSQKADQEEHAAHSSCPALKILWLIQRGQCSKCDYYEHVPLKRRSFFDRMTGKRDTTLADRLDHSQILSPKRREQRARRLPDWRHEIEPQQIRHQQFLNDRQKSRVRERKAAFEAGFAALRAQEERDSVPLEDRVVVYDEEASYSEMLAPLDPEDQDLARLRCYYCSGYYDEYSHHDELKMMPCGHTIHNFCFQKLYYSSLRTKLECPACDRKYKVLIKPKFPVNHEVRNVRFLDTEKE